MIRLLSILTIILAIILFPPAVLAVLSNNAVPGDGTYPIKRSLEDGIYAIASLNPTSKAWFSAARSDRRFKEFSTLLAQGKSASNTLNELVIQTDIAAEQIKKIDDPIRKQELISQLSNSIEKYDLGLQKVSEKFEASVSTTLAPTLTQVIPQASPSPPSSEELRKREESIDKTHLPVSILTPSPTPPHTPIPTPAPTKNQGTGSQQQEVNDAIDKLKKIKDTLKNETKSNTIQLNKHEEKPQQDERSSSATQSKKEESLKRPETDSNNEETKSTDKK